MMAAFNIAKRHLLPPRRLGTRDILNKSRFEAVCKYFRVSETVSHAMMRFARP